MTDPRELPDVARVRWPALVALDRRGTATVLDVVGAGADGLRLSDDERTVVDPRFRRPRIEVLVAEALADLAVAGAIEERDGVLAITDDGRRMTEADVTALASVGDDGSGEDGGSIVLAIVRAFLESI
jgi:hypothetical protein